VRGPIHEERLCSGGVVKFREDYGTSLAEQMEQLAAFEAWRLGRTLVQLREMETERLAKVI